MSDAPEMIWVEPPPDEDGEPSWYTDGVDWEVYTRDTRYGPAERYRRADIPWLPEELVGRIGAYMDGNEINAPIACAILRDILAACEGKE